MLTINSPKLATKFVCEPCYYKCSKESDYKKHLQTHKHKNATIANLEANIKSPKDKKTYSCNNCGISIKHLSSLSRHKKKCVTVEETKETEETEEPTEEINISDLNPNNFKILTNLVLEVVKNNSELLKQNHEFQKQMVEVCKTNNTTNNSHHNNSHNKTFNLNFFLNEQCKDAMNIMDFVNTFQLQFSDLERIGEVGYVEGISNIIISKLNEMDIYKRPIHCSDAKREIMYVKDNDVWDKDNDTNDKLRLAIRYISKKNSELVIPWRDLHPGVRNYDHRLNDKYQEIIMQTLGGKNSTEDGETKIIRKISKMVLIDKSMMYC
jgi:hypothetical protein